MTTRSPNITAERVRELLDYEPDTGVLRWRINIGRRVKAGSVAGSVKPNGRRYVCIDGRFYQAHRLIWLHVTGNWPVDEIDHKNVRGDDNWWDNLREATGTQNQGNVLKRRTNTSGFKGVSFHKRAKKYVAQIGRGGTIIYLGCFDSPVEAHAAYVKAARATFGEFARAD